jgi:hypothetical protein
MGKKRKLDIDASQSTQSVGKRTSQVTFRVAKTPVHTTSHSSTSTSLVTTLRKGVSGRRGHRREQCLPNHPPTPPSEQQRQPDEIILDPPLPDLEYLNDAPKAPGPKGVRKNTTSVSVHPPNRFGAMTANNRRNFLNGLFFGKAALKNCFVTMATVTSLVGSIVFPAGSMTGSTNVWIASVGASCAVRSAWSKPIKTIHSTVLRSVPCCRSLFIYFIYYDYSPGTAFFLTRSRLKALAYAYNLDTVVASVFAHLLGHRTSVFSTLRGFTVFPLIFATVDPMASFMPVPNFCVPVGSLLPSIGQRLFSRSIASTRSTNSRFKEKCPCMTFITRFSTKRTTWNLRNPL